MITKFKANGYDYTLIKHHIIDNKRCAAIFKQEGNTGYEVHMMKFRKASDYCPEGYKPCSNTLFGYNGWYYTSYEDAEKKYHKLYK